MADPDALSPHARVLWHASRADVDRPTIAGRTRGTNHANSGLGLYCATGPHDYIAGFGDTVFALTLHPQARVMRMGITQLRDLGRSGPNEVSREWFDQEGRRLGERFDVIDLVETNGQVDQTIVLNDAAIVAVRKFSAQAFLAQTQDRATAPSGRTPRP